jgi:hypothetical protein
VEVLSVTLLRSAGAIGTSETFAPSVDIVIFYGWSSVAEIAEVGSKRCRRRPISKSSTNPVGSTPS